MNNDIRESLTRLGQLKVPDLTGTSNELETLLAALRKEVEAKTAVVAKADLGKLMLAAG